MNRPKLWMIAMMLPAALALAPAASKAQPPDSMPGGVDAPVSRAWPSSPPDGVTRLDLSGPRVGMMFLPAGQPRTLFGWHLEHQIGGAIDGPSFLVETVWFIGGIEHHEMIPIGTLMLGTRTPGGYEFGIGPSLTFGRNGTLGSAVVLAAGRSYRFGGVRVPFDVSLALDSHGQRVSISTGWAVREPPPAR